MHLISEVVFVFFFIILLRGDAWRCGGAWRNELDFFLGGDCGACLGMGVCCSSLTFRSKTKTNLACKKAGTIKKSEEGENLN